MHDPRPKTDWVARAFELERDLGREVDWFDRTQPRDTEELAVREIYRAVALLALAWHVPPQTVLLFLSSEAPDELAWGRLVSRSWDSLPASARANLNAFASKEAA